MSTKGSTKEFCVDTEQADMSSMAAHILPSPSATRVTPHTGLPSDTILHPRIAVFGSCDFYHKDSAELCHHIGRALAEKLPNACILTGANAIVQEKIARAFYDAVVESRSPEKGPQRQPLVFHLAPKGFVCDYDFGTCLEAGSSMEERRAILASVASVCISVEGGPGVVDEMEKAFAAGSVVVPLARTGGASSGMFEAPPMVRPECVEARDWELLADDTVDVQESASAAVSVIEVILQNRANKDERKVMLEKAISGALGASQKRFKRPVVPDGFAYVEPTLGSGAHLVVSGKDLLSRSVRDNEMAMGQSMGNIYLGSQSAAGINAYPALANASVTAIVNCTNRVPCYHRKLGVKYCQVAINDEAGADVLTYLEGATTFMHAILSSGDSVLVHCEMGVSRSATVVIAYLVRCHRMTRDDAYLEIKKRRPMINPNPGFWEQLEVFEQICKNKDVKTDKSHEEEFDTGWAIRSNALFATSRDFPGVLEESECFGSLSSAKDHDRVLFTALDFVWGRGVLVVDVDWLACVCRLLDDTCARKKSAASAVKEMLTSDESEFSSIWAGEIYEEQIKRVLDAL